MFSFIVLRAFPENCPDSDLSQNQGLVNGKHVHVQGAVIEFLLHPPFI
jgi:hypothetical protein